MNHSLFNNKSLSPFNLPLNGSILFDNGSINDNGRTDENNLDWSTGKLFIPKEAALIGFVLAIMIGIVGMLGNLMTIAALYKHQTLNKMHSRATTMFVIHLAIADFLFCLLVMPITSGRYLTQTWPFGSTLCRLYPMVYYGTVATSLMLITIITINRLVLIAFNQNYNRIYTKQNVYLMIIFCWAFSYGLMSVPFFELWGRMGYKQQTFSCTILRDDNGRSPKKFLFILGFFLPMSTIIICYGWIFLHIKRQTRIASSIKTSKRDLHLTVLISVVFGAFLFCFLPLFIGNVFIPEHRYPYFHVFSSAFAWLNSCINPFIYFAINARYRQAFKKLFQSSRTFNLFNNNSHTNHNHQTDISMTSEGKIATILSSSS